MKDKVKSDDITIRTELLPGDLGYVCYLHGHLYDKEYNYGIAFETYVAMGLNEFYQNYDSNKDRVWVCEHKNTIVGFLLLMNRGKAAQLRYFILEPAYRCIGLGNKLMDLFIDFLKKCNYESAYLWTTQELQTAAHLYTKYGFKLTKEKESHAFGKSVIEQCYELVVTRDAIKTDTVFFHDTLVRVSDIDRLDYRSRFGFFDERRPAYMTGSHWQIICPPDTVYRSSWTYTVYIHNMNAQGRKARLALLNPLV